MNDMIPTVEIYRGVAVHDRQSTERITRIVKPSIDQVISMTDAVALLAYAGNISRPPEARLLAAAKLQGIFEQATEERRVRPNFDLGFVKACVAGLSSEKWRDPRHFCSLLCVRSGPGGIQPDVREVPLVD